jgi:hypothetical protein
MKMRLNSSRSRDTPTAITSKEENDTRRSICYDSFLGKFYHSVGVFLIPAMTNTGIDSDPNPALRMLRCM